MNDDGQTETKSANTLRTYVYGLKRVAEVSETPLRELSADELNRLMGGLRDGTVDHENVNDDGYSKSYMKPWQSALRGFYAYHDDLGVDPEQIVIFTQDSSSVDDRDMYTEAEVQALRDAVDNARNKSHDTPVMLLTRTNALRDVGVPFEVFGSYGGVWRGELRQMLAFLNNVASDGSAYAFPNLRHVLSALPDGKERKSRLGYNLGGIMDADAVAPAFKDFDNAIDIADYLQIAAWKRDVLKNAIDAPASLKAQEVKVGTVHTSKGLEAPSVYLFTASSKRTVRQYSRDADRAAEEHRIYYVGTTRASSELHLVSEYFDGPTAPPIQKVRRHGNVVG